MKYFPLNPIVVQAPFQQWGIDFISKFKDNSRNGYAWILTTTNYFTKWVEAIPTKKATDAIVMDFLEDKIITRFGVPARIITDNGHALFLPRCRLSVSSTALSYLTHLITIPKEMV